MSGPALFRKYRAITDIVRQFDTSDASLVFRSSRNAFFPVIGLTACEYAVGYICPEASLAVPTREKRPRDADAVPQPATPARKARVRKEAVGADLSRQDAVDVDDFASGDSTFLQTAVPSNRPRRRSARLARQHSPADSD